MTKRIFGLSAIASDYKAILCDVWGVLHNGQSVYRKAEDALARYRESGGFVVLLTNSPRPNAGVRDQLDELGVGRETYDAIVTSGDVTRTLIENADGPVFHMGPKRDLPLFEGLQTELVSEDACKTVVCTGLLEDEVESPDD
jgi:ribonucleotide monophosphatase NagD (HAD superfamily)